MMALLAASMDETNSRQCPDIVGISCITFTFPQAVHIARIIKERDPSITVVLGGQHVTFMCEEILENCEAHIDYIVQYLRKYIYSIAKYIKMYLVIPPFSISHGHQHLNLGKLSTFT